MRPLVETPRAPRTNGTWAAAFVLFAIMVSHAVLETARDALFLARLSAVDLAWAYGAIAVLTLASLSLMRRLSKGASVRRMLVAMLAVAALITAIMAGVLRENDVVFAFYVWTGLIATLAVPLFWVVAGQGFSFAEAKKRFIRIGAGASLGAAVGSAVAAGLAQMVPARRLVAVGAALFLVSAIIAAVCLPRPIAQPDAATPSPRRRPAPATAFPEVRGYLRWLGWLGLVSTMALTLGDLAFKTVAKESIEPRQLATFFGTFYAVLNLVALVVQLVIAPRILRFLGVAGAMLTLPVFIMVGGIGFALTGAFASLLVLKLGDGGLRHSLHRVTSELLFLPLSSAVRERFKAGIDALSQRGGQAFAALIAFAVAELADVPSQILALGAGVTAVLWLLAALVVRRRYVERFRETLQRGQIQRSATLPTLDLRSLEVVFEALGSLDEAQAIAALDLLAEQDRTRLVPSLILFHPSVAVVQRALELLDPVTRPDIVPAIDLLVTHADPQIRAAALAVSARAAGSGSSRLEASLADPDPNVRATAAVVLGEAAAGPAIEALVSGPSEGRRALAHAIGWLRATALAPKLDRMLRDADAATAREIARAIERAPDPRHIATLLPFLADRDCRAEVRRALVAIGEPALVALVAALTDPSATLEPARLAARRHIPRTLQHFAPQAAVTALVAALDGERDGVTAYKILRALGRLRHQHPKLAVDERRLSRYALHTAEHAEQCARWQARIAAHFGKDMPASAVVIAKLIDERRRHALERVLRICGILEPGEDFEAISKGLLSDDVTRREASRELLDHHLSAGLAAHVIAAMAPDRLAARAPVRETVDVPRNGTPYVDFVAELLADSSESLRCLAAYHAADLGLVALIPKLLALRDASPGSWVARECGYAAIRLAGTGGEYARL